ncbi:Cell division protein FtsW [hydrothermal vent metagenome]|uniref:Cell division protein FtsW n=1 Tax=hydrothermal vent metagenome TaxID=652676 RepID=A0A3B0XBN2_9ZZZZ
MMVNQEDRVVIYRDSIWTWLLLLAMLTLLVAMSVDALAEMLRFWETREEYSHGYLIPVISVFLIWQKKEQLEARSFQGAWSGVVVIALGVILILLGNLSTISTISQYGFVISIFGIVLSYVGIKQVKIIFVPLLFLLFMVPLPGFFLNNLSAELQLISSQLGVFVIRLFNISVYLEGNVIDLGTYKLQVVEACSGLNYLFPLMTLAFIASYFYQAVFWKRLVIFLSSIPVTIFMNSFRIGVIGVLVEYWGPSQAEGFLHDFEGWIIFMLCTAILIAEMWLLNKLGNDSRPLREVFGVELPEPTNKDADIHTRKIPKAYVGSLVILLVVGMASLLLERPENIDPPDRKVFSEFPDMLDTWKGKQGYIEQIYLDVLKLTDYMMRDYVDSTNGKRVNFYSAYYASQKSGSSAHSPKSCIPGGGWRISSFGEYPVEGIDVEGVPLVVNRLVIQKGESKQLVYYWFQQRGRIITNEYMVKWYLFWDSLTKNRTDGALIRITALLSANDDIARADQHIKAFIVQMNKEIGHYIPGK